MCIWSTRNNTYLSGMFEALYKEFSILVRKKRIYEEWKKKEALKQQRFIIMFTYTYMNITMKRNKSGAGYLKAASTTSTIFMGA